MTNTHAAPGLPGTIPHDINPELAKPGPPGPPPAHFPHGHPSGLRTPGDEPPDAFVHVRNPQPPTTRTRRIRGQGLVQRWELVTVQAPTFFRPQGVVLVNDAAYSEPSTLVDIKTMWRAREGSGGDLYDPNRAFFAHHGFGGGCFYLPSAGRYYVSLRTESAISTFDVEFTEMEVPDPWLLRAEMEANASAQVVETASITAGATTQPIWEINDMLAARSVVVSNQGANPAAITWGSNTTATQGMYLPAGWVVNLKGPNLPCERISCIRTGASDTTIASQLFR